MKSLDYRGLISIKQVDCEIIELTPVKFKTKEFRYQNIVNKILFFLFREGISRMLRKIKSKKFTDKTQDNFVYVIVKSTIDNCYYNGLQYSENQPIFYFTCYDKSEFHPVKKREQEMKYNPFLGFSEVTHQIDNDNFSPITINESAIKTDKPNLFCIGCGGYVLTEVLPVFEEFNKKAAIDFNYNILTSKYYSQFELRSNDFAQIKTLNLSNQLNLGIIASYHSYHTAQAIEFLSNVPNSKVIIEKPPCITKSDLKTLAEAFDPLKIFIGYHRRYAKWNQKIKTILTTVNESCTINMIIHEVQITNEHWYQAPNQGTRIAGNLSHWIDLSIYWLESTPSRISIAKNEIEGIDNSIFTIHFSDGSLVNLIPTDKGNGTHGVQEYITIKSKKLDVTINDYLEMKVWQEGKSQKYLSLKRKKGHEKMNQIFKSQILSNSPSDYTKKDLIFSTFIYMSFVDLYKSKKSSCKLDFSEFI